MKTTVVLKTYWCNAQQQEAKLLEDRLYPDNDFLDQVGAFRVDKQCCSLALECSTDDYVHCAWSGAGVNFDPFGS